MANLIDTLRLLKAGYTKAEIDQMSMDATVQAPTETESTEVVVESSSDSESVDVVESDAFSELTALREELKALRDTIHADAIRTAEQPAPTDDDPIQSIITHFNGGNK